MGEYIRREDAIKCIEGQCVDGKMWGNDESEGTLIEAYSAIDDLMEIPPADAATVVRCKDCVCCMEFTDYAKVVENAYGKCYMRLMNSEDTQYQCIQADDFCSCGKRKDGDSNDQ